MIDRENVIKGLECLAKQHGIIGVCEPENCTYGDLHTCANEIARDAIALLKAQEPRVMTLEEYEAWIDTPFTERNPVFHEERTKRGTVTSWVNTTICSLREYGKNDRCWTSRPDEKRRAETPWN